MPTRAYLDQVRRVVLEGLDAEVYLFGFWAKGTERRTSDIDVAVLPNQPLPPGRLAALRERLHEGHVPYEVEVVDLAETDPTFRRRVLREGTRWAG